MLIDSRDCPANLVLNDLSTILIFFYLSSIFFYTLPSSGNPAYSFITMVCLTPCFQDGPQDSEGSSICRVEGDVGVYDDTLWNLQLPHGVEAPTDHRKACVGHPLRV